MDGQSPGSLVSNLALIPRMDDKMITLPRNILASESILSCASLLDVHYVKSEWFRGSGFYTASGRFPDLLCIEQLYSILRVNIHFLSTESGGSVVNIAERCGLVPPLSYV
jgi:hypothetical protein